MAADRISKETAELVALPPYTWETRSVKFLLNQEKIYKNIDRVPINQPLYDSIVEHGIKSPILCMPNYYPIAGSQRMRALWEIVRKREDGWSFKDMQIEVCRFDKENKNPNNVITSSHKSIEPSWFPQIPVIL